MELNLNYNVMDAEPVKSEYDLLPRDWYLCKVDKAEVCESKSNPDNKYLKLELVIVGADYTGRRVWKNINFQNANKTAQDIGAAELKALISACGFSAPPRDTDMFIGNTVYARIVVEKGKDGYADKNTASDFKPVGTPVAAATNSKAPF